MRTDKGGRIEGPHEIDLNPETFWITQRGTCNKDAWAVVNVCSVSFNDRDVLDSGNSECDVCENTIFSVTFKECFRLLVTAEGA